MVDYSKWDSIGDDEDDKPTPTPPPRPPAPTPKPSPPQPCVHNPPPPPAKLQSFVIKNSRIQEVNPCQFRWDLMNWTKLRKMCTEANQGNLLSRIGATQHHSLFQLVLKLSPNIGIFVDDQGANIPNFTVRFCYSDLRHFLQVNVQSQNPLQKLVGFEAHSGMPMGELNNFSAPDDTLVILVIFDRPPGAARPTHAAAGSCPAHSRGGPAPKDSGSKKGAAQSGVAIATRNRLVAAVFMATAKCLTHVMDTPIMPAPPPLTAEAALPDDGLEARIEKVVLSASAMSKRNEYRLGRLEEQLERIERAYAQPPAPRGKKKGEQQVQDDPLGALRQALKTSIVQLDALEKQRGHLHVAIEQQAKEIQSFKKTNAAQNQEIGAQLSDILRELREIRKAKD